jgi:hypothetical protein
MASSPIIFPQALEGMIRTYGISIKCDGDSSEPEKLSEVFRLTEVLLSTPTEKLAKAHAPWIWLLRQVMLSGSVQGSREAKEALVKDISHWVPARESDKGTSVNILRSKMTLDGIAPPKCHEYDGVTCPLPRLCGICSTVASIAERDDVQPAEVMKAFGKDFSHSNVVAGKHPITGASKPGTTEPDGAFEFIVPRRRFTRTPGSTAAGIRSRQAAEKRDEVRNEIVQLNAQVDRLSTQIPAPPVEYRPVSPDPTVVRDGATRSVSPDYSALFAKARSVSESPQADGETPSCSSRTGVRKVRFALDAQIEPPGNSQKRDVRGEVKERSVPVSACQSAPQLSIPDGDVEMAASADTFPGQQFLRSPPPRRRF